MGINGKVGASCKQCDILEVPTTSGSACRLQPSVRVSSSSRNMEFAAVGFNYFCVL